MIRIALKLLAAGALTCIIAVAFFIVPCIVMSGDLLYCGARSAPSDQAGVLVWQLGFGGGAVISLALMFWPRKRG